MAQKTTEYKKESTNSILKTNIASNKNFKYIMGNRISGSLRRRDNECNKKEEEKL